MIVTGGANAGKTGVLHDAVRDAQRRGAQPVLLLPSQPEVERAEAEFAQTGALGIRVMQFDDYLGQLWAVLGDGRAPVRYTQRSVILDEIVRGADLRVLAESALRPGFMRMLEGLVRRAGESSALDGAGAANARSPLGREMLGLIDAYGQTLRQRGLIEPADAFSSATALLQAGDLPDLVAVNRFSITVAQMRFIRRCAEEGDITVGLTWTDGHPATVAAQPVVEELLGLPGARHAVVESRVLPNNELEGVERYLFGGESAGHLTASGRVTLSEAAGQGGEAARIARDIQDMEISGIAPESIAVVYRHPEQHVTALISAFKEASIAVDIDARVPIASIGLGRALMLLLAYVTGGRTRADLMGFLRSGYSWADLRAVDRADADLRRNGVKAGSIVTSSVRGLGANTRVLLERAEALADAPIDARTIEGWRQLVADMLRARHGAPALPDADGGYDAATQRVVMTTLEEIAELAGDGSSARHLLSALRRAEVGLTPSRVRPTRVQVMSAERARARRFSAVIVAGLNAKEFPALPLADAFSSPGLSAELGEAGIDVTPRVDMDAERLLFYQVVTGARDRLILSRTVCDDDGIPTRASSLWEEFLDLYRDPVTGEPYGEVDIPVRRLELADLAESEDAPVAERRRLRAAVANGRIDEPRAAFAAYRARKRTGCLPSEVLCELANSHTFSITEIEAYLACPFRWFYDKTLGPQQLDKRVDPLAKGSMAHEILRRFYEERSQSGAGRVTPDNLAGALERHSDIAAACKKDGMQAASLAEEELLHAAVVGSRRIVQADATFLPGFHPVEHELGFDTAEGRPDIKTGSFCLKGRIDRVDESDDGIIVIDYKSGSTVAKKADFEKRGLVQLPLYGLVASALLGRPLLGGVYRGMAHSDDRGFYLKDGSGVIGLKDNDACDADEFREVIDTALEMSERAVQGMRAGHIEAVPARDDACRYCGASAVCGGRTR